MSIQQNIRHFIAQKYYDGNMENNNNKRNETNIFLSMLFREIQKQIEYIYI